MGGDERRHRPDRVPRQPLREPSALPFGLPPFAGITPEHCREALLAGMAGQQRAEVAAIVSATAGPTFDTPWWRSSDPAGC